MSNLRLTAIEGLKERNQQDSTTDPEASQTEDQVGGWVHEEALVPGYPERVFGQCAICGRAINDPTEERIREGVNCRVCLHCSENMGRLNWGWGCILQPEPVTFGWLPVTFIDWPGGTHPLFIDEIQMAEGWNPADLPEPGRKLMTTIANDAHRAADEYVTIALSELTPKRVVAIAPSVQPFLEHLIPAGEKADIELDEISQRFRDRVWTAFEDSLSGAAAVTSRTLIAEGDANAIQDALTENGTDQTQSSFEDLV